MLYKENFDRSQFFLSVLIFLINSPFMINTKWIITFSLCLVQKHFFTDFFQKRCSKIFIKKETPAQVFSSPVNIAKFLRTIFFENIFGGCFCKFLTKHFPGNQSFWKFGWTCWSNRYLVACLRRKYFKAAIHLYNLPAIRILGNSLWIAINFSSVSHSLQFIKMHSK